MGRRAVILLLGLLALFTVTASAEEESGSAPVEQSDVLVLDIHNFAETVKKYDFLVVEFYAPWCGHCKNLEPEYAKAATALKSHDPPITLAKCDLNEEENKPLASKYEVTGFPTLKVIRHKGETVQEYKGPREADGIVKYLKKLSGPASVEIKSADEGKAFFSENEKSIIVLGLFKSLDGEEYANFAKVAEVFRSDYSFAHTVDASYVPDNGVPLKVPSVRVHKDFDDKIVDFTDFGLEALGTGLEDETVPLVTEMSKKPEHRAALMRFFESPKDKVFLFLEGPEDPKSAEDSATILSAYRKDAKKYKPKGILFLFIEEEEASNALQFFGLSSDDLPAYVIQTEKGKKYIEKNAKSAQLAPMIEDFLAGTLTEIIKSDPIPATNDEPVKVVVANSFKEVVQDAKKDVFLEFYAPWCGHCKKLAPVLDEVATSFESDPDVVIAKFDATTNDVPTDLFDVKGFPTLYLYSAAGQVIPFDADRTKEGIIGFINQHRSKSGKSESNVDSSSDDLTKGADIETVSASSDVKDEL